MSRNDSNFERGHDGREPAHEEENSASARDNKSDKNSDAVIRSGNPLWPDGISTTLWDSVLPSVKRYQEMMDRVLAPHAAIADSLRTVVFPAAERYQEIMDRVLAPHAATADLLREVVLPSEKIYKNIMAQVAPSPYLKDAVSVLETTLSTAQNNMLHILSSQYLWDISNEGLAATDELEVIDEEKLREQFEGNEEPWADPVHTAFIQSAAQAGRWLEEKYPTLKQKTIQALSKYVTLYLYYFIPQLALYLATNYGVKGLMVASTIAAGAGMITPQEKKAIDRGMGLAIQCDFCGAKPGDPCVTKSGKSPGTLAKNMHKPRLDG